MSQLLQVIGRGIELDVSELIWQWLKAANASESHIDLPDQQRLDEVIRLVDAKKPDTAAATLRDYLSAHPACICGRLAAAALALADNRLDEAVSQLNHIYRHCAGNVMALYALGHCCERQGKEAQALAFYQDCLKFKSYLQLPRQRIAAICFKNGRLEKTIQQYELLRDEYPDEMATLLILGYLYIAAANYDCAAETFSTAILIHPDNFQPDTNEIDLFAEQGQLQEALDIVEYMAQDEPQRPDIMLRRGDILSALGAHDDALDQYQQAIQTSPDFLEANIKLGTQYLRMDRPRRAAQQFNRAVEVNDRIVDAYIGLALAQKLAGKRTDALTTLALAAAIDTNASFLFAETAILQFQPSHPKSRSSQTDTVLLNTALNAHKKQIETRPHNPDLYYRLATLLMRFGRTSEAIGLLKTALTINPTFTRAACKLAICLLETDEDALAIEQLAAPEYLTPDLLSLHYEVALLYCNKPKFASSLLNLTQTIDDNVANADPTQNISIVLQNLGLLDRAATAWHNLLDLAQQAQHPA